MLEEEEKYLVSVFEQWTPLLRGLRPKPEMKEEFPVADAAGSTEPNDKTERFGDSHDQDHTPDELAATDDVQLHAAIASNLEPQTNASRLGQVVGSLARNAALYSRE